MKKGGFLRNVLDTIRSNPSSQQQGGTGSSSSAGPPGCRGATEFGGLLKPQHFSLSHVARHGFPEHPTALAFDPVQKIAAIGTKSGALRVFGRPGIDVWGQHKPEFAVTHIKFIVNQGAIITVTSDESIHLWSLRGPNLKLQLSTNNTGLSPGQSSQSPTMAATTSTTIGNLTSQQSVVGTSQLTTNTLTSGAQNTNSGAQPGDPDYLADQMSSSPTSDQSKQYSRQPEILHTLKFQREHITCLHQTLMSKWLYIGTERGNVHVANVETFELSGYSIAWNKAIELSRKTHPGAIIHISECPQDTNKLLIGYESGCIALWDLKSRNAEGRYYHTESLLWLAWHHEGKQFVAAHGDGSLVTWQTRSNARPVKVIQPHAKTAPQSTPEPHHNDPSSLQQQLQQPSLSSSFARALNNELYRPIYKVDWKTSKNNEQFLLFSGGLPFDGLEQDQQQQQSRQSAASSSLQGPRQPPLTPQTINQQQQQQQQYLKSSPLPGSLTSPSPLSPSISPSSQSVASRQSHQQQHLKEKKSLRSTSLTVMYGKSITVLEMDETIIDFITVCDNSPYENDTSDPFAVLVLLANDLILIDLTSSGYPSFDSPYPASSLNESPVTCVQYLADCSGDLIPFLYSTSQNVVSRAPKKGFSDKEWPINGGEWGQSMQSYPELVLTGHADGTIKFWDMSGVNFDLISKIKTSKLFERPNKPPNSIVLACGGGDQQSVRRPGTLSMIKPTSPDHLSGGGESIFHTTTTSTTNSHEPSAIPDQVLENFFAIEKIEYYPGTRHLVVAGALSQIIQFKLNKKDTSNTKATTNEMSVILVEPSRAQLLPPNGLATNSNEPNQSQQQYQPPTLSRQHLLLKAKSLQAAGGSSSSGSSSSSSSHRTRSSGFLPELICITPLLTRSYSPDDFDPTINPLTSGTNIAYLCQAPPKVKALAFQAAHSILAYSHENGIVLVDIIQKCVIMNASLADLYGMGPALGAGASIMTNNRDITVQPFATGFGGSSPGTASGVDFENLRIGHNSTSPFHTDGGSHDNGNGDSGVSMVQAPLNKSAAINDSNAPQSQPLIKTNEGSLIAAPVAAVSAASTITPAAVTAVAPSEKETQLPRDNVESDNSGPEILGTESRNQQPEPTSENPGELCPSERTVVPSAQENVQPVPKSPPPPPPLTMARARLEQTKSMALLDSGPPDEHPVAPPRHKKRQSVPLNNELLLRRHQRNKDELDKMMIKVELGGEKPLECGPIEHDDSAAATADDVREIDRLLPGNELANHGAGEMKHNQHEQQHPSPSSGSNTISSLFTKLMAAAAPAAAAQKPVQSRHIANSMFQRQLSTTALNSGSQAGPTVPRASSASGGPKLFQRQLTTSQLFSGPSSSSAANHTPATSETATNNKQRAAALLASARGPSSVAHGDTSGLSAATGAAVLNRPSSSNARRLNEPSLPMGQQQQPDEGSAQKRPTKNKRIISRMLSISAIHTGSLGLGGSGSGSPDASNLSGSHQQLNIGDGSSAEGGSMMTTVGDQAPDKIDSSFTRSRSSSASSGAQIDGQLLGAGESILCLCFLDWALAASGAAGCGNGGPMGPPNHKSVSSIGSSDGAQVAGKQVALWLGTSQGRVLLVGLDMPDHEDNRILQLQSVNAEPIPQAAIKLPGAILCLSTFTCEPNRSIGASSQAPSSGAHLASQSSSLESDGPQSSSALSAAGGGSAPRAGAGQEGGSTATNAAAHDARAALFMLVVSEKQAKVYQIPAGPHQQQAGQSSPPYSSGGGSGSKQQSGDHLAHHHGPHSSHHRQSTVVCGTSGGQLADSPMAKLLVNKANCVGKQKLSDSSNALRSQLVQMRQPDESCLATYLATGDIAIHSLPKLNVLLESEFVPASSPRIGQSMCFSRNGHALYQPSPTEVAKFTLSAHYKTLINDMTGCLYVAREMPEMPRANFFKSLFSVTSSVASKQSDRDELFGSDSGKASTRGVAKHIPSAAAVGGLDKLKGAVSGGMAHEMRLAREGLDERGEKLSEIEDRTLQMMNQSETYSQTAHQLAQKFKDKKWYQF